VEVRHRFDLRKLEDRRVRELERLANETVHLELELVPGDVRLDAEIEHRPSFRDVLSRRKPAGQRVRVAAGLLAALFRLGDLLLNDLLVSAAGAVHSGFIIRDPGRTLPSRPPVTAVRTQGATT
jgi:hypothetical protein